MMPTNRRPKGARWGALVVSLLALGSLAGAEDRGEGQGAGALAAPPDTALRMAPPSATPALHAPPTAVPPAAASAATDMADLIPGVPPDSSDVKAPTEKSIRQVMTQEFLEDVKEFQGESQSYQDDVRRVIRRKLAERSDEINKFYNQQVQASEIAERTERLGAIALFERFLTNYPGDSHYTPDAMIRLAELYYEQTRDEHDLRMTEYQNRLRMGATDEPPPEETPSYQKSIALYQRIISQFPEYEHNHAVYYMLAWALNEQKEEEQAEATFRELTEKFPKSPYVPEAWMRIGEYYFNNASESAANLQEAISAYQKAANYKESKLYDKALYKLGWTYYRLNDFDRAVAAFLNLVDFYDGKKGDVESSADLREEALQYAAISFGDDAWGSVEKLNTYLTARGARSYDSELFRRLGKYLYDGSRYDDAILAFRIVLQRNPLAPDAPDTAERLIRALNQAYVSDIAHHKEEDAIAEGDRMAEMFSEGGSWQRANKDDHDVLQKGRDLVERIRLANASFYFKLAVALGNTAEDQAKAPEERADALARSKDYFRKAAASYAGYLRDFPRSKNVYSIQFSYAYALYQSGEYLQAADIFTTVRDSNADNAHFQDAAYYVVAALQKEIAEEEKQGKLTHVDPCIPVDACKSVADFSPRPIADIRLRLISAADVYLKRAPKAEDGAQLTYIAGQTFYTYYHFDEARNRYGEVVKRFPATDFAQLANDEILYSYLLQKNWLAIEEFVSDQLKTNPVVKKDPKKLAYLRNIKYTARFARAEQALADKKWDEAAKLFESVVADSNADGGYWSRSDECLMNAAFAYRQDRKFDSAATAYTDVFTNFAQSKFAEEALFRVADAHKLAFDFESAIKQYLMLVDRYGEAANLEDRKAALFNAAQLLEAVQRYPEAAKQYQRYADLFPDAADAPDMAYEAVNLYSRMHDNKGLVLGLRKFINQFRSKPLQAEKIVEAHRKIAKAYLEDKEGDAYKRELKDCVKAFDDLHLAASNTVAARAASECRFELAEGDFADFQKRKLDPRGKKTEKYVEEFKKQFQDVGTDELKVKATYLEVVTKYRWGDTTIGALYRLGTLDAMIIDKLTAMPCPQSITDQIHNKEDRDAACETFLNTLRDQLTPQISERSANAFQQCSDKAFELRIVNDWSKRCMEEVCKNTPKNCRSLKDPREEFLRQVDSPRPLVEDNEGTRPVQYGPPKPATPAAVPTSAPVPPTGSTIGNPGMVVPMPSNGTAPAPMPPPAGGPPSVILPPSSAPTTTASIPGGAP
jgi:TolA-binding protein